MRLKKEASSFKTLNNLKIKIKTSLVPRPSRPLRARLDEDPFDTIDSGYENSMDDP